MKGIELRYNMWRNNREEVKGISGNLLSSYNEDAREDFLAMFDYEDGVEITQEDMYDLEREYNNNKFIVDSYVCPMSYDLEYYKRTQTAIFIPNNVSLANLFIEECKPVLLNGNRLTTSDFVNLIEEKYPNGFCLVYDKTPDGSEGYTVIRKSYFDITTKPIIEFVNEYKILTYNINYNRIHMIWDIMTSCINEKEFNDRISKCQDYYDNDLKEKFNNILNKLNLVDYSL